MYYVIKKTPLAGKILFSANGVVPYSTLMENAKEYTFEEAKRLCENVRDLRFISCETLHEKSGAVSGMIDHVYSQYAK